MNYNHYVALSLGLDRSLGAVPNRALYGIEAERTTAERGPPEPLGGRLQQRGRIGTQPKPEDII